MGCGADVAARDFHVPAAPPLARPRRSFTIQIDVTAAGRKPTEATTVESTRANPTPLAIFNREASTASRVFTVKRQSRACGDVTRINGGGGGM